MARSKTPLPGRRVRGSATGRPLMALLDLLGRRWALRIIWELRDGAALTFRELQERCSSPSPTVQNQRLAELRDAGVIEHSAEGGYRLTARGTTLRESIAPLSRWAEIWAKELR